MDDQKIENQPEWIETKKEFSLNANGEQVLKTLTIEPKKYPSPKFTLKDWVDLCFKIIGLVAIITPLWLTFYQRKTEILKQRSLYELDIITNTTSELHSLLKKNIFESEYNKGFTKLFYELKPKMALLQNKNIDSEFISLQRIFEFRETAQKSVTLRDSLLSFLDDFLSKKNNSKNLIIQDSIFNVQMRLYVRSVNFINRFKFRSGMEDSLVQLQSAFLDYYVFYLELIQQYAYHLKRDIFSPDDVPTKIRYFNIEDWQEKVNDYLIDRINNFDKLLVNSNNYLNAIDK